VSIDLSPTRVLVLADGAPAAGRGHLSRCSGVVAALRSLGVATRAMALDAIDDLAVDGVEWARGTPAEAARASSGLVVLGDTYRLDPATARGWGPGALAWFHDGRPARDVADVVVIAPRMASATDAPGARVLGGFEHVSLRPGMAPHARAPAPVPASVLVTLGATPTAPTIALARLVAAAVPAATVRAVACAPPVPGLTVLPLRGTLADELERAEVLVCAGGQTSLEAAALGVPMVLLAIADNQRANVERLRSCGAALVAHDGARAAACVRGLLGDAATRNAMSRAGRAAVDGHGAARIAAVLAGLGTVGA
jgi:spore coat polysaccharide biosynthesis predicted glycosyltransferase SpsG